VDNEQGPVSAHGAVSLRDRVAEVARSLRGLHRALLDVVSAEYERTHGPVGGTSRLLNLVMYDPAFRWMHALSELMVDVDELLDGDLLTDEDAAAVRVEVERLISPAEGSSSEFAAEYVEALQADPSLIMTHAMVRRLLGELPGAEAARAEEVSRLRPEWAVRRRTKRRDDRSGGQEGDRGPDGDDAGRA
jgi:hypothetical protein